MPMTSGNNFEFSFAFGQKVRILAPHPDAGATGEVTNAYHFVDSQKERVFVAVPGGHSSYAADELEAVLEAGSK